VERRPDAGFTLIELMIVIAIIAIIAAIAIPNLLAAKVNANETAAIATLRNLVSSEAQISVASRIDTDNDGKGEYGTLLEMTGAVGIRKGYTPGTPASSDFSVKGGVLNPAVLSSVIARVDPQGYATKSGYAIIVFLPDSGATADFVHEVGPATSVSLTGGSGKIGTDLAETTWCAYAQPIQFGGSGTRRFFTSQKGDIMQSSNDVARGQGTNATLPGKSAFLGSGITSAVAVGTKGQDGDIWKVTN